MLLCPNCASELSKDPRNGEGAWVCKICESDWFILDIPKPKHLREKGKK